MDMQTTRPAVIGAGYLYHCIPKHQVFHEELLRLGGQVDFIEYLAAHFSGDPAYLGEINAAQGSIPSSLHSYEYMIGSVERPRPETLRRLQQLSQNSNCQYIGEHVGMVGTRDDYSGTFLQPFGTTSRHRCSSTTCSGPGRNSPARSSSRTSHRSTTRSARAPFASRSGTSPWRRRPESCSASRT
ncbi:DUF692 family protein [Streptacidiphilus sp. 4-A2]|nr:DUF692 family protein [Streptacidiphilus sp. 4-A2]